MKSYLRRIAVMASLGLLWAPGALAQSAENKAAARNLGIEGIKLADAGDCEGAVEKLKRAEALYHAPTILGRLGECQVSLGRIVEGTENLNRVVREPLPSNAPSAYLKARERAQKVLDDALPRIAKLKIIVTPNVEGLAVKVSDTGVPSALIGAERPTDPGTHVVVAEAPGYELARAEVTLKEGGRESVTLTMTALPEAAPEAPAASPPETTEAPPATPTDTGAQGSDKTLAYALLGVGGVGILAGGVTGFLAMNRKGELDDKCASPGSCPKSAKGTIDSANNMALISTIGFGVGIASAAVGTFLLLSDGNSSAASAKLGVGNVEAQPFVGLGYAGVSGTF
jgi:hypothetical protein